MPTYTFETLSSLDFEELVRDLLQEEYREQMETFAPGADGGVDVRLVRGNQTKLTCQCKHYVGTGFDGLLRTMK
jgi:hypothetical protein